MKNMFVKKLMFLAVAALLFSDTPLISAQETSSDEFTLEEITVTAQKREENQQKVAITMDVISSEEITERGMNNIDEIFSNISSAIVQKAGDGYRVSIRGMTDTGIPHNGQSQSTPTVAINTDGVYSSRRDSGSGLYDLERVEILYGPQSTLYTSNSPGGIVNVVTAQPKTDRFEASGTLEVGNYGLLHTQGSVNVPVSNISALRAAFTTSKRDGYLDNDADNEDKKSARIRALLQPNDRLSFTVTDEYSKDKGAGFGNGVEPFFNQDTPDDPWTGSDDSLGSTEKKSNKVYGQMNLDTDVGALSLTSSYSTNTTTSFSTFEDSTTNGKETARESAVELRMTSPEDFFFKWIVGLTYYDSYDKNFSISSAYIEDRTGQYSDRLITEEIKALYANATYPVVDNLRAVLGIRRSYDDLTTKNNEWKADPGTTDYAWEHKTWENDPDGSSDYKVGIEYDVAENSMFYLDFSTSYRVQGMGSSSQDSVPIEKLKAYEIGSKNRFLNNKLQVNASAYYNDYRNFSAGGVGTVWLYDLDDDMEQDSDEVYDDRDGSVGDGYIMGFDLSASAAITMNDLLSLSVTYTHSEWTDLYIDYVYDYTLKVVDDEIMIISLNRDYNGKPMMNTPPWTATLNYTHSFDLSNGGQVKTNLSTKVRSSYRLSWDDDGYPYDYQEGYHIENFSVTYNAPSQKWNFSSYINNIFEYAEKTNYMRGPILQIGNPRTYGAVLTIKY